MTAHQTTPFDLTGPLPSGTLAIEASAGTGKTFALAALATRLIAEGYISAPELLIVTFTRAATGELRARVRDRLVEASECLAGEPQARADDVLVNHLRSADGEVRLDRLRRAITEFDSATITTIHGFAAQVRGALGASPGIDGDARLVDDTRDLVAETCADALTRAATQGVAADELPGLGELRSATELAVGRPDMVLVPTADDEGVPPAYRLLRQLVVWSVHEVSARRRRSGTVSFDDLLTQLHGALDGPGSAGVIDALRSRFKVALIDEFQDTDSVQWGIFSKLFGQAVGGAPMVLVGDPKQAIYGFRGADIHTYLQAIAEGSGTERQSLVTNWRSDGAVLSSLAALFEGANFGDDDIPFVEVDAAPANRHRRVHDAGDRPLPALSLRLAIGGQIERTGTSGQVQTESAARAVNDDLVAEVRSLLDTARIPAMGEHSPARPIRPSDIAVLVTTRAQGGVVQAALLRQGVPAVVASGDSVLQSPAADQMRYLLAAMDRPSDPRRVRMFALSWFVGWGAEQVASASEIQLATVQGRLRDWSDMLATHAAAEVLTRVWTQSGVVPRVLGAPDGDRHLTDLNHLAELLYGATPGGLTSVAGMLAFLDAEPDEDADTDVEGGVTARRIESEDEAVQVMTVWMAKGQEFPVVCLPSLWRLPKTGPVTYTDRDSGDRILDLTGGGPWPDKASGLERKEWAAAEALGEQLRLLYVAMTRAQHQTVVWWANGLSSDKTALAHLLFARTDGVIDPASYRSKRVAVPPDSEVEASLAPLVDRAGDTLAVAAIDAGPRGTADRWVDPNLHRQAKPLGFVPFDAPLQRWRHRWSFSAITNYASPPTFDPYDNSLADAGADDEQEVRREDLELLADGPEGGGGPRLFGPGLPGPLAWLPAGTAFGTLVHAVLEDVDFTAPDLVPSLTVGIDRQLARRALDLSPRAGLAGLPSSGRELLVEGLRAAIESPLGPMCGDLRLADVGVADRLNEMSFELHLGEPGRAATVRDIGRLVLNHLDEGDALHGWAAALAGGAIEVGLAGHLTGSIDLIMRVRDGGGDRFVVADYKTNQLTPWTQVPRSDDYHQGHLAVAMAEHEYPLQALLYSVALHRYLRWRQPGYEPAAHLGGVAYLFLRGMTGPSVAVTDGRPHGVFSWPVPPVLVTELSDLLAGRLAVGSLP